ncbi:uncharacterized protein FIBRA_03141 [Fibroporia radiculosa]|uniref:Fungal-type protein kinase domain-containing protein n=1 Tax=Fibroporia radiculosa TaxID=599839 RepID=J4G4B5_9APHY|nr:uncharacterized protein FIBRA_03141 [Fibroporia radiculosa]CCM01093.1 predicted protein [Fibroporia radiculosa]
MKSVDQRNLLACLFQKRHLLKACDGHLIGFIVDALSREWSTSQPADEDTTGARRQRDKRLVKYATECVKELMRGGWSPDAIVLYTNINYDPSGPDCSRNVLTPSRLDSETMGHPEEIAGYLGEPRSASDGSKPLLVAGNWNTRTLHRMVVSPVGRPLETFRSSRELIAVMYDAIQAHRDAWEIAGILHKNICPAVIMMSNDLIAPYGLLIDWEI